ncbi:MAG: hypothetical protein ACOCYT_04105 [Chloroflexota bacterium]
MPELDLPDPLETSYVSTEYDRRNQVLIVRYFDELTAESTQLMYSWCLEMIRRVGLGLIRGVIYDFSNVKRFTSSNLIATQRGSLSINAQVDLSRIPIALVARSLLQEQHLSISLNATPGEERKRIVRSIHEALTFIEEFHRNQGRADPRVDK